MWAHCVSTLIVDLFLNRTLLLGVKIYLDKEIAYSLTEHKNDTLKTEMNTTVTTDVSNSEKQNP
jgi:hypothetical protein